MSKKKKTWSWLAVGLIFSLVLSACAAPPTATVAPQPAAPSAPAQPAATEAPAGGEGKIVIGAALCLTGIQAPLDEPALRGAQLAVEEINKKGGVLGKQLELINLDGKSDPVTVGNVAVQLIEQGANAMIAPSDFDFGARPAAEPRRQDWWASHRRHHRRYMALKRWATSSSPCRCGTQPWARPPPSPAYTQQGLADRLRGHRRLHRLHQVAEPLLYRAVQGPGRQRSSSKTRTPRAAATSRPSWHASRRWRSSPISSTSHPTCRTWGRSSAPCVRQDSSSRS